MNRFFIFHTAKRYGLLARRCARSFAHWGVPVTLIELRIKQDWMRSCMARSIQMVALAEKYPSDGIALLDSDLTCMAYPEVLVDFQGDIAVHDLTDTQPGKGHPCNRYSAGVSVFGATKYGRECLRRWAELCTLDKNLGDPLREQVYLHQAIHEATHDQWGEKIKSDCLTVTNIGEKYNRTIDRFVKGDDTVILHHVASRRLRTQVGGRM